MRSDSAQAESTQRVAAGDEDGPTLACLRLERRGPAAWVYITRAEVLNSISPALIAEFRTVLTRLESDPSVRALVISGTGRAFCTGGDLKAIEALSRGGDLNEVTRLFHDALLAMTAQLERMPFPVIAAVNGLCLAGGLELALCCDIVIAAEDALFGDAHARYGLLPGGGGSVRLPRKIGVNRAKYLMFTAAQVSARCMMDWGLVSSVAPVGGLEDAVAALVADIAPRSPLGLRRMKQMVDDGMEQPAAVALRNELATVDLHNRSHDRNEGLAAFAARRTPVFTGR